MTRDEFQERITKQFQTILNLNNTKGHDYAGQEDALANFKRHAKTLDISPEKVWGVYASKHWDAVLTYIREGEVQSESVNGRIMDLILYLFLLDALVEENS